MATGVDSHVVDVFAAAAADVVAAGAPVHRRVADLCGCCCFISFRCSLLLQLSAVRLHTLYYYLEFQC